MKWEISYRRSGEMLLRFATITGNDEFEARANFHAYFPKCFIKTIVCKKEATPAGA